MGDVDRMARAAGFINSSEVTTCTDPDKVTEFAGIDIVASPTMPEGWVGMRTDKGVMCMGPGGNSLWVPAFDLQEFINRPMRMTVEETSDGV
jgi:hypothetical protein